MLETYNQYKIMELESGLENGIEQGMKKGMQQGLEQGLQQGIEQGLQQGIEQGLQQGIEQGLQQGIEQGLEKGLQQGLEQGIQRGLEQGKKEKQKDYDTLNNSIASPSIRRPRLDKYHHDGSPHRHLLLLHDTSPTKTSKGDTKSS